MLVIICLLVPMDPPRRLILTISLVKMSNKVSSPLRMKFLRVMTIVKYPLVELHVNINPRLTTLIWDPDPMPLTAVMDLHLPAEDSNHVRLMEIGWTMV